MRRRLVFLTLLIMGAAFLIVGIFEFSNRLDLSRNGLKTEGTVINLKQHHDKKRVLYQPEIEFKTRTGQIVRFDHPESSTHPKYLIGQKVPVIYSREDPANAALDSTFSIFLMPLIFALAGVIILLLDVIFLIQQR
ncbi:MAG TPA: DUF3592 domain-containing protein [Syntrophomonadaceae bacterium]|nr:DUF3592 domain-containing protein [Syntrophomonadaceae bacterium]